MRLRAESGARTAGEGRGAAAQGSQRRRKTELSGGPKAHTGGAVGACQTGMVIWSGRAQHLGWPTNLRYGVPRDGGRGRLSFLVQPPSLPPGHFPLPMDRAGMDLSPELLPLWGGTLKPKVQAPVCSTLYVCGIFLVAETPVGRVLWGLRERSGGCKLGAPKEGKGGQGSVLERCLAWRTEVSVCLQSQKCNKYGLIFLQLHSTRTFQPPAPFHWGCIEFQGTR